MLLGLHTLASPRKWAPSHQFTLLAVQYIGANYELSSSCSAVCSGSGDPNLGAQTCLALFCVGDEDVSSTRGTELLATRVAAACTAAVDAGSNLRNALAGESGDPLSR